MIWLHKLQRSDFSSLNLVVKIHHKTASHILQLDGWTKPKVTASLFQLQQVIQTRCIFQGCDDSLSTTEKFRDCGIAIVSNHSD